jgi:predicted dehydrogenase/nucleoside-diphosphate-sugar epimerase
LNTATTKLKYLVLGGGAVVAEFHLPALAALGWLDDVWVADPAKRALDRLTARYPAVKVLQMDFRSALSAARELGIQAVIVALPNALHEAAVMTALECGLDVLCEKPLALTETACQRLADMATRSDRVLAVGMTRRFLPSTKAIRSILDAGWIGGVLSVEAGDGHDFAWSSDSGAYGRPENAGVLANVGVHAIDLVEHLFGTLTPVAYMDDWAGGVEVNATLDARTGNGIPVRFRFSYTHPVENGLRITGARGQLSLTGDLEEVHLHAADSNLVATVKAEVPFRFGDWPATLVSAMREELCDFHEACIRRRSPAATAADAIRTASLIDWAYSHHQRSAQIMPAATPRLKDGRIVVTGGTGFVGSHLLEALAAQGHRDITVPIRSYHRSANTWKFPVRLERADLLNRGELREVLQGARYVFHLAFGRDGDDTSRVTVEGTENVVEAAIECGAECVVVVSTTAVFDEPGAGGLVDETSPYRSAPNPYEAAKAKAERWAVGRARCESGTRIVVINPSCIYGPRGNTFTRLPAELLVQGAFCWIENGRGVMSYVYVKNLVDAIVQASLSPMAHGERFIVSDGTLTWRAFFTELFSATIAAELPSCTREELEVLARETAPSLRDLVRAVTGNEELWRVVRENPTLSSAKAAIERLTPAVYRRVKHSRDVERLSAARVPARPRPPVYLADLFGATNSPVSAQKARRVLGWTPRIDLVSGQAASRAWLAEIGLDIDARPEKPTAQTGATERS